MAANDERVAEVSHDELHKAFGFIIALQLVLLGLKNQSLGEGLFKNHILKVWFFIVLASVYTIAWVKKALDNNYLNIVTYIYLICGTIAYEVLLSMLLNTLLLVLINIFSVLYVVLLCLCPYQEITPLMDKAKVLLSSAADLFRRIIEWFKEIFTRFSSTAATPAGGGSGRIEMSAALAHNAV